MPEQMTKLPFNSPFATIASPAATLAKEIASKVHTPFLDSFRPHLFVLLFCLFLDTSIGPIFAQAPADLNHVFFVTGGSEANDTAMQVRVRSFVVVKNHANTMWSFTPGPRLVTFFIPS